jgi:hypothetical protein
MLNITERRLTWISRLCLATLFTMAALAQTSNLNLDFTFGEPSPRIAIFSLTGSAGSLGNASLALIAVSAPIVNGNVTGPKQATFRLAFNLADTIAIAFDSSDPDLGRQTVNLSGGTITGGTGAYSGASGSLDLTITKDTTGATWSTSTTSGSGTLTVEGATKPLTLTNFRGWCCVGSWRDAK